MKKRRPLPRDRHPPPAAASPSPEAGTRPYFLKPLGGNELGGKLSFLYFGVRLMSSASACASYFSFSARTWDSRFLLKLEAWEGTV